MANNGITRPETIPNHLVGLSGLRLDNERNVGNAATTLKGILFNTERPLYDVFWYTLKFIESGRLKSEGAL